MATLCKFSNSFSWVCSRKHNTPFKRGFTFRCPQNNVHWENVIYPASSCCSKTCLQLIHADAVNIQQSKIFCSNEDAATMTEWRDHPTAYNTSSSHGAQSGVQRTFSPPLLSVAPMMMYTDNHFRYLARLLTQHTWLYTEMVVDNTLIHQQPRLDKWLEFPTCQQPLVLQLGGSNAEMLAEAVKLADSYGYTEINLNCGCPSETVAGKGCFGASLMLEPQMVGAAMASMAAACSTPVTVKCRIGVDNFDSYDELCSFIRIVSTSAPVKHFIIHARKALLKGLSPSQNRTVPPLKYEFVYALIRDFPHLQFTLNGGITSLSMAKEALQRGAHGVMIGRSAYSCPWSVLGDADRAIYGAANPAISRREVLEQYAAYADATLHRYKPGNPHVRTLITPLLGLFHSEPGGAKWKRVIDTEIRHTKTVSELLRLTLPVLSCEVLDAPPPLSAPAAMSPLPPLPLTPRHSSLVAELAPSC